MKKIVLASMLFLLTLPFSSAFAMEPTYEGGVFDNNPSGVFKSFSNSKFSSATDNDLTTFFSYTVGSTVYVYFNEPIDVNAIYSNSSMSYSVYNGQGLIVALVSGEGMYDTSSVANAKGVSSLRLNLPGQGRIYEFEVFSQTIVNDPVRNLKETHDHNSVSLSWTNAEANTGVIIKQNGVQIADLDNSYYSYKVEGLDPETKYTFDVIAKYGVKQSEPVTVEVTTDSEPQEAGDITDLKAEATHNRVNLSWNLPKSEKLQHVNIYRDEVIETSFIDSVIGTKVAKASSTKIFETNGTYFNDLTVQPEKTYEYTLTTTSTDGIESKGVTTTVTTLSVPIPEIEGGGYEKDPSTGNYTYYWEEPTTGKVKVLIDGQLYATVNASDKQIVIPMKDMKFDVWGTPKVELIPVSEDGKEGEPVKPPSQDGTGGLGEVEVPFGPSDLLTTSTGLFWLVGAFVLLALSFLVVPKLRKIIVNALGKKEKIPREERLRRERSERPSREVRERKEPRVRTVRISTREQRRPRLRAHRERLTRAERKG